MRFFNLLLDYMCYLGHNFKTCLNIYVLKIAADNDLHTPELIRFPFPQGNTRLNNI